MNESVRKHVDPWFATGLVYMHDTHSYHLPAPTSVGTTVDSTVKLEHHGVGIPLAIGVDYRLTRAISIGPSFEYTFLVPILADATGAWTAGLDIRFTPF